MICCVTAMPGAGRPPRVIQPYDRRLPDEWGGAIHAVGG